MQLLNQLFVGFGSALLVRVGRLIALLEDVAQVSLARLDPFAQVNEKIQRDRRLEDLFFDLLFAGLDPLGYFDLLLALEELKVDHLLEVEPYRVGRIARVGGLFVGFLLGLGLDFALGALGGDFPRTLISMSSKLSSAARRSVDEATSWGRKSLTCSKVR